MEWTRGNGNFTDDVPRFSLSRLGFLRAAHAEGPAALLLTSTRLLRH